MARHSFVIADDHPLFRDALKQTVAGLFDGADIHQAETLDMAIDILKSFGGDIDLILLDLKMPGVQGFSGLVYMRAQFPNIPTVIVSAHEDSRVIRRALGLGASGFIPKSTPIGDMQQALKAILDGDVWAPADINLDVAPDSETDDIAHRLTALTPQQMRVLMMLRGGLLNKQIAYELSVSEATVKAHVSAILQKLNVDSRTQAVIVASRIDGDIASGGDI